jgi:hypothetical protein
MALTEGRPASAYINRVITSEDYEHSALSPSGAHRWMRCPGSHALETRIAFKPRKFSMTVTHEMAADVQIYLDNLAKYNEDASEIFIEQALPISHITGEEGATGSGDAVILDFPNAEIQVHDLKFGRGVEVDAEGNEQLALYLLGALELFDTVAPEGGWQSFRSVIHQPRISPTPSECVWPLEELMVFATKAIAGASFARIEKARRVPPAQLVLVPGDKQCRFCDAKATCPALTKTVAETVLAEFVSLDALPAVKDAQAVAIPADNAKLAGLLELVPMIESWCSHLTAHAEAELLAGNTVPGYKLVQGKRGNRKWSSEEEAEGVFKSMRVKHDEMYDYSVISPTTAEKRFKEHPKQWARLQALITQSDGKPSVAPASDKRPALEVTPVADEFKELA